MTDDGDPVVLVVEDDPDLADLYARWLDDGFEVRVATDGAAALDLLADDVEVVLLDRRMPGLSGDDVLSEIDRRDVDCQIAVVTAVEPDFDIIGLGFDDYLVKPVSEDELRDTVSRLLTRATYDAQLRDLFSLASKRAVLETEKSPADLEASEEYAALVDEIKSLRDRLEVTVSDLDEDDLDAVLRGIASGSRRSE